MTRTKTTPGRTRHEPPLTADDGRVPAYGFAFTEVCTAEYQLDKEFFAAIFGWDFEEREGDGPQAAIRSQGTPIGMIRPLSSMDPDPRTTSYVVVQDLHGTIRQIKENGGVMIVPETAVPGQGRYALFRTPGGCVLAAWQDDPSS